MENDTEASSKLSRACLRLSAHHSSQLKRAGVMDLLVSTATSLPSLFGE